MARSLRLIGVLATVAAVVLATVSQAAPRAPRASSAALLTNWPEFGLDPQRSDSTDSATGITAANVTRLGLRTVTIPGTADNSAIYLHGAVVKGARHDIAVLTTTYGITLAIDADSGRILWRFTPSGIGSWKGSGQITTGSPIAGPGGSYVYATSPNGLVHKLATATGREAPGWPVRVTPAPQREKLTASLNIADGELLATTGGYFGDTPPYVGHIVAISLASGHVDHVFNTLCANRTTIIVPATCSASDSAILSRSGPVVEPGAKAVLIATGNGPYDGTTNFGDSVIELTLPDLTLRQVYTPTGQAQLNANDTDLGSGSPALLPGRLVVTAGKDGILRVLNLARLDGHPPGTHPQTGGELQTLPTPGNGQQLFSAPAVWHHLVFVADGGGAGGTSPGGTAAYRVSGGRLHEIWQNTTAGTSPVLAGGLLYVYNPAGGGIVVYNPTSGTRVTTLAAPGGHWNSPIVVDGHIIEPTGNANDHAVTGSVTIYSVD